MAKHKWLVFFLAVAIAVSALLPFTATTGTFLAQQKSPHVFASQEHVLICTGTGFKWVTLADIESGKEKPKEHSEGKCPLCYAARHGLQTLIATPTVIARNYERCHAPVSLAYNSPLPFSYSASPLNVRAPPALFIG